MRKTHVLFGIVALTGGLITACSSDPDPTDPTGTGGTGAGTNTGGTTTTMAGPTTSTGGGGMTGDGNDSFEEAQDILTDGTDANGTLEPPATDQDFYKFTGEAGRLLGIFTEAKPETDEFDPTYVDLVITLYDQDQQQIARNDDPYLSRTTNDSNLWTVLPADGTYYVKVEECISAFPGGECSPIDDEEGNAVIINTAYTVAVQFADPEAPAVVLDAETGNDETSATTMKYAPSTEAASGYGPTFTYGFFTDEADVDVFSFTIPTSPAPVVMEDLYAAFFIFGPEGPDGMGTTGNAGDIWITDANGVILSQIDNTLGVDVAARDIRAAVEPGTEYFLWVQHPGTAAGGHDFYIISHVLTDTNPLEAEEATNGTVVGAESLTQQANGELESAFVTGNISAVDSDHFELLVPSWFDGTVDTVTVACGAHRSGSGVRELMVSILDPNGVAIESSMAESEEEDLVLADVNIGAETVIVARVEAGISDPLIMSDFYQCGFHFVPAPPETP